MEAISHAGTALGILTKEGIVLAAEKKTSSKLLDQVASHEKLYKLNENTAVAVAGLTADANNLIQYCRNQAAGYSLVYNEPIPIEQLVQRLCDMKQGYTQYGGTVILFDPWIGSVLIVAVPRGGVLLNLLMPFGISSYYF
jgi:20S proteasome subunit alpha 3